MTIIRPAEVPAYKPPRTTPSIVCVDPLLLTAQQTGMMCGKSLRTCRSWDSVGKVPRPVRSARTTMWRAEDKDFIVTKYAQNLIRFKARQLCRRADFQSVEREDVEQRLWLALVKRAAGFTPDRASLDTFIDRVIATAIAMIVREQQSKKCKNGFRTQSLDEFIPGGAGQPETLSTAISEEDLARRVGRTRSDAAELLETQDAFANAHARMTPEERSFCRQVMSGSLTSAARDLNISRRQARRILQSVRAHFERAGFGPR